MTKSFIRPKRGFDEINHLKSKYGNTMEEILQSAEEKQSVLSYYRIMINT